MKKVLKTGDTFTHGDGSVKVPGTICQNRKGQFFIKIDSVSWKSWESAKMVQKPLTEWKSGNQFEVMYAPLAEGQALNRDELEGLPVGSIVSYNYLDFKSHDLLLVGDQKYICHCLPGDPAKPISNFGHSQTKFTLNYLAGNDE